MLVVDVYTPAGRVLTETYGSLGTPTFIFFEPDGVEIWRTFGSVDPDQVRNSLP